jgi:hypothetical protein
MSTISHVNKYLFSVIIVKFLYIKYKMLSAFDIRYPNDYFPVCRLQCETNIFLNNSVRCTKKHCFVLRFPGFALLAFLIGVVLRLGWAWSIGGVILTEEDRSTGIIAYLSATSSLQISHKLTRVCHLCRLCCPFHLPCFTFTLLAYMRLLLRPALYALVAAACKFLTMRTCFISALIKSQSAYSIWKSGFCRALLLFLSAVCGTVCSSM